MPKEYKDIPLSRVYEICTQEGTVLIDVRDEWEFDEFNIGGVNIPLPDIRTRKAELLPYNTLLVICTNGMRSRVAAKDLCRQPEFQEKTILHVQGGILEAE